MNHFLDLLFSTIILHFRFFPSRIRIFTSATYFLFQNTRSFLLIFFFFLIENRILLSSTYQRRTRTNRKLNTSKIIMPQLHSEAKVYKRDDIFKTRRIYLHILFLFKFRLLNFCTLHGAKLEPCDVPNEPSTVVAVKLFGAFLVAYLYK